jgi:hypothetical protein
MDQASTHNLICEAIYYNWPINKVKIALNNLTLQCTIICLGMYTYKNK